MRVLAVDGGQSAIRMRHSTDRTEIAVEGVSRQEGDTVGMVADAVLAGWRRMGMPPVDRAVLGLTTAPTDAVAIDRLCRTVAEGTGAAEVWLTDDAVTTHAGALSLGWGVSITAGTGVACLALPRGGEPRIIGGHGFLLGDEGGAFWIGREGLRAALRAADGRGPATALSDAAARRFQGLADLGERLHSAERPVNAIAHFAPDVLEVAAQGDAAAEAIAVEAARELALLAQAGVSSAGGPGAAGGSATTFGPGAAAGDRVPVALGGRLLAPGSRLRARLDRMLPAEVPGAAPMDAHGSPLDGAMGLGLAPDPGHYTGLVRTWKGAA